MRTASMVLGIVGSIIALLTALLLLFGGIMFFTHVSDFQQPEGGPGLLFTIFGGIVFIGAALAVVGGAVVKRKNVLGGVFMLIGAALSFVSFFAIFAGIILIIGGVFAFVKDASANADAQPLPNNGQATQINVGHPNYSAMKPYSQIKQQARESFKSQHGTSVGALVLVFLILYTLTIVFYAFYNPTLTPVHVTTMLSSLIFIQLFNLLSFGASIFVYPAVMVSYNGFTLRVYHENKTSVKEMFRVGFAGYWRKVGGMLWMQLFVGLWSMLFVIPGIIKAYSYFMTPYILADCPNVKATQALRLSMRMTAGYKGDIFVMQLTFIGWWLLSVLTLGVLGLFYTGPYYFTSMAGLYEDLKRVALENGIVTPEELGMEMSETALV